MRALPLNLLICALHVAAQQCYYARDQVADSEYVPCSNDSDVVSACCLKGDCLGDQTPICWNRDTGITYLGGCTDSAYSFNGLCGGLQCGKGLALLAFEVAKCALTCRQDTQFVALAKCGSGWRCCDGKGQKGDRPANVPRAPCPSCDPSDGVPSNTIAPGPSTEPAKSTTSTTSFSTSTTTSISSTSLAGTAVSSTASSSTTPTTVSTTTSVPASSSTGSSNEEAAPASAVSLKLGLGVGLPIGAAAIGLATLVFFLLRRRRRGKSQVDPSADGSTAIWRGEVHAGPPAVNSPPMASPHTQSSMHFSSPPQSVLSSPKMGAPDASPSLPLPYPEK